MPIDWVELKDAGVVVLFVVGLIVAFWPKKKDPPDDNQDHANMQQM